RLALSRWEQLEPLRQQAAAASAEGLMLKALASPYLAGRRRGHWWKHKREPYRLDAVLLYAQAGSGRRANLFTDYTFGLWDRAPDHDGAAAGSPSADGPPPQLVTFAKAYSGLDDGEITALDRWIRSHTTERFGPVRAVQPVQVFELAFEGLQRSSRHKSGIAVRFPRIARWRRDKPAHEADTLVSALALLESRP
ncbi:MAG: Thermostable ligase, partial [Cyanobacteriota bacterium]